MLVGDAGAPPWTLSHRAQLLLAVVREHQGTTGRGLTLAQAAGRLGISSKRMMQQLVDELERSRMAKTHRVSGQGQPRVIEIVESADADQTRTKPDETDEK